MDGVKTHRVMTEKEAALHKRAMDDWKRADQHERRDRELCAEDLKFSSGGEGQWPQGEAQRREAEGRPMITVNRLAASIKQVINDARQNRPGIKIIPAGTDDPQAEKAAKKKAEVIEGLIRQIEATSKAQNIYMPAYELMVRGGFRGSWRICTRYCDDEGFDQEIYFEPISSPFSVYRDPDGKRLDRSDDRFVHVVEDMSNEAFKARYPGESTQSWDGGWEQGYFFEWRTQETVRVCEYWYIEEEEIKRTVLDNGDVVDGEAEMYQYADDHEEYAGQIAKKMATRKIKKRKVMCATMNGVTILDGPHEFPSKYIPIVSVEGPRQWVGDKMHHWSLIRDAKGPQQLYNFTISSIAERSSMSAKQPFIATAIQVGANPQQWANANKSTDSTLVYTADPLAPGPPQRQQPSQISQAEVYMAGQMVDDIKACMGIFDRSLGNSSQETSGRAILAVQAQGDNATYDFPDMLATAIGYGGMVTLDMIPRVYNNKRTLRTMNPDDSTASYTVNNGDPDMDLTVGRHEVEVAVGPSFQTKRMEMRQALTELATAIPQVSQVGADLLVRAHDGPGMDELADRLRKTLPPGLAKPMDGEEPEQPPEPPPPDPEVLIKMRVAKADVELKEAQREKVEAETAGVQLANEQLAMSLSGGDQQQQEAIRQLIIQTLGEMAEEEPPESGMAENGAAQPEQGQTVPEEPKPDHLAAILAELQKPREPVQVYVGGGSKRMNITAPSGAQYQGQIDEVTE
jgi:hypothetical protein